MSLLQKYENSLSVILSLSKNDGISSGYITLRQAQGDKSGLLQEAQITLGGFTPHGVHPPVSQPPILNLHRKLAQILYIGANPVRP